MLTHLESFTDYTPSAQRLPVVGDAPLKGMWVEKSYEKGIQFRLFTESGTQVGNLWLGGDLYYKGSKYIAVKIVNVHTMMRGMGFSYLLYRTALANLDDYAGICSEVSAWTNKKQVPRIHKQLGSKSVRMTDTDGNLGTCKLLPVTPSL